MGLIERLKEIKARTATRDLKIKISVALYNLVAEHIIDGGTVIFTHPTKDERRLNLKEIT